MQLQPGTKVGFSQLLGRSVVQTGPGASVASLQPKISASTTGEAPVLSDSTPAPPSLSSSEDFETMVGDLRRVFLAWLKRTEVELERERQRLASEGVRLEEERRRSEAALAQERQRQLEQLREERKRAETEMQSQLRQVTVEREESRKKLAEDRAKFEAEMKLERDRLAIAKDQLNRSKADFEFSKTELFAATPNDPVRLNIGGQVFTTSRKTLLDGARSSDALVAQLAGSKESETFVDRDGELFRDLLNCVRSVSGVRGRVAPRPKDVAHSDALVREADFYGISLFPFPLSFVVGGATVGEEGVLRTAELLTAEDGVWRSIRAMQTERLFAAGCGVGQKILMAGGQNVEYAALSDCEVYDALIDVWMEAPALRTARRNAQGVTCTRDGRVLVMGGFDGERILSSVEGLDGRMSGWMQMPSMTTGRSSAGAVLMPCGTRVLVTGGTSGERLKSVEIFDLVANKWETCGASMNAVRSSGAVVTAGERIFAIGGIDGGNGVVTSMEMYEAETQTWNFRQSPIEARVDAAACGVAVDQCGSVMLTGGQNSVGEILASVEIYDVFNDQWMKAPEMVFPRYGHSVVSLVL